MLRHKLTMLDGTAINIQEVLNITVMLSMSELISWCKDQGMAIGTARGSVGGSRVAYVTDIIDLNPETWHTVFSRFCNEDREEINLSLPVWRHTENKLVNQQMLGVA